MTGPDDHWFEGIARFLGDSYLRYSFTKGTRQEVDFLVDALGLTSQSRVLDVGCGPGRHARELARRGIHVHGIDVSREFVEIARAGVAQDGTSDVATFRRLDARRLHDEMGAGEFDAVICLCQGAFGLMTAADDDERVIRGLRHCLVTGGRLALSAFNAYFAVKYHEAAILDADSGVAHEITDVRNPSGDSRSVDLWTGCYTPKELRLLLARWSLAVDAIHSVEPGAYQAHPPSVETPEFLVLATAV